MKKFLNSWQISTYDRGGHTINLDIAFTKPTPISTHFNKRGNYCI